MSGEFEAARPGECLGGMRGTVAAACDFAREIAIEWEQRVTLRITGRRDQIPPNWRGPGDHDGPSWDVYAADSEVPAWPNRAADHAADLYSMAGSRVCCCDCACTNNEETR